MKVGNISRYSKRILGYSQEQGFGLYEIACQALEKEGYPKPDEFGCKRWVKQNEHIIMKLPEPKFKSNIDIAKQLKKKKVKSHRIASTSYVATNAFLSSYEWRKVRMEALKKYGAKCQCCGATPATGAVMNVDHIKPRKYYPSLALKLENLQILCHDCNHGKGNWDETDWRTNEYFVKLPNI